MNASVATTSAKPLDLDLRGKSLDEVVTILKEHGYSNIEHQPIKAWGEYSIFNLNPKP